MLILGVGGSIDTQLGKDPQRLWKDHLCQCWSWGGGGSIDTQLGKDLQRLWKDHLCQCWSWGGGQLTLNLERIHKDFGRITSANADPGGGCQSTLNLERICKDFGRIASANADPGGAGSTLNLERICKDFWRIASANADPAGGSINTQLGKDLQRLWKDPPLPMLILGGGQLTLNLERICKDFGRIASANADPGGRANRHSTWKGSAKTLEGSPLPMLILGGSINTQLGKDPQRLWKDCLCQCWSWGGGSIDTQLGKDLQRLWKDHLCQCWSWGWGGQSTLNLERICKDFGRIASANADPGGGSIDTQLGKDLQRLWKDRLCQCWSWGGQSTLNLERIRKDFGRIASANADPGGGVNQHSTWKGSAKTLEGSPLPMLILGGAINTQLGKDPQRLWKDHLCQCWSRGDWSTLNLERVCKDFGRITFANADPGGRGVDWHSTWKGSAKTLEGSPLPMLILGVGGWSTLNLERIRKDFGRIASANADPGGGGSIDTQLGKDLQRLWKDHLCQCWSWGGWSTLNLERIRKDFGRIASAKVDPGGGRSTLNLERIRKDFGRIASDNADPGGGYLSAPDFPCAARVGH